MSDITPPERVRKLLSHEYRFEFGEYHFVVPSLVLGVAVGMVAVFVGLAAMDRAFMWPLLALAPLMVLVQGRLE